MKMGVGGMELVHQRPSADVVIVPGTTYVNTAGPKPHSADARAVLTPTVAGSYKGFGKPKPKNKGSSSRSRSKR